MVAGLASASQLRLNSFGGSERDMSSVEPLDVTIARWKLGRLLSEMIPRLAVDLLVAGYDSPSLRRLAGITQPTEAEAAPLLTAALTELGAQVPTVEDARGVLVRFYAGRIADDGADPYEPAQRLLLEVFGPYQPEDDILPFLGLTSQIQDYDLFAATSPSPYLRLAAGCRADLRTTARGLLAEIGPGFVTGLAIPRDIPSGGPA